MVISMGFCKDAHSWTVRKTIYDQLESPRSRRNLDDMAREVLANLTRIDTLERKFPSVLVQIRQWVNDRGLATS